MGVAIGSLFKVQSVSYEDLRGRVVIIDAYNVLHQFLASIRQPDGTPLKDAEGKVTSHLSGLLYRTSNLMNAGVKCVFCFDGRPHPLKARTLAERMRRKEQAEIEWRQALEAGDLKLAKSKAQQTGRLTDEMVDESKALLDALGIPVVQAPSDGEAQACWMVQKGDGFAVGSQDYDCLLIGAPVLLRNLTSSERRKLPGKQAYAHIEPKMIRLEENLEVLGVSQQQLVDMGILIGTDFNPGVHGVGPKTALKMIKEHGSLEAVLPILEEKGKKVPSLELVGEIRSIFLRPNVTGDYSLNWKPVDIARIEELLCENHGFSRDRMRSVLSTVENATTIKKQSNLFDF